MLPAHGQDAGGMMVPYGGVHGDDQEVPGGEEGDDEMQDSDAGEGEASDTESEEDVLEFDLEEMEKQAPKHWLALARFFSVQRYSVHALFGEMRTAWLPRNKVHRKELHDNMFLLEFMGEGDYNFVMMGGPWIHKGDALIIVPYDGKTRPSEVAPDAIPLWIQLFDLPGLMMTKEVREALGRKLGKFLEYYKDDGELMGGRYLRIKVAVPLKKPLKPFLELKVNGVLSPFKLKYERVLHFCFKCGRLGHADRECQFKGHGINGFVYGEELRGSPHKKVENRSRTMHAMEKPDVARGLHFANPLQQHNIFRKQGGSGGEGRTGVAMPPKVAENLAKAVDEMKMGKEKNLAIDPLMDDRVTLGPSYESSGSSSMVKSMTRNFEGRVERVRDEQKLLSGQSNPKLVRNRSILAQLSSRSRDSDCNWKHSKVKTEALSSVNESSQLILMKHTFETILSALPNREGCSASAQQDIHMTPVSPLGKRSGHQSREGETGMGGGEKEKDEKEAGGGKKGRIEACSPAAAGSLTGAQGEPRQEQ
ncbi:hypothetical protein EJB05_44068, partial [Eragrostis curvula]